jgi:hypothetical protein
MSELKNALPTEGKITPSEVKLQGPTLDPKYTDSGVAKLVVGDMTRARAFQEQKQWAMHWNESDVLYQSPRGNANFEGSVVARANVSRFTVAKHVNSLSPMIESGLFYENPPFVIRPRPAQSQRTAEAKMALYGALLDEIDFEDECVLAIEGGVLSGTAICKGGWVTETKKVKRQVRTNAPKRVKLPFSDKDTVVHTAESDEFKVIEDEVTINRPFFEWCPLGSVFVDPGWRHANRLDKAKYVIHQTYPTFKDLDKLRTDPAERKEKDRGYDIPSEQELKDYFFGTEQNAAPPSQFEENQSNDTLAYHPEGRNEITSDDPMERPIEMLERWDKTYVMTVLRDDAGKVVIIRNEEHGMGRHCFFSWNFWNIPGAGYGLGCGRLTGSDQRIEKGMVDGALDILSYSLNPSYARDRGANVPTQQIRTRLAGIVDVDVPVGRGVRDAFGLIEQPRVPAEVFPLLQDSRQSAQSTTGADEAFTQGSLPGKGGSSAARTATGAGGIIAANAGKIQGPVGRFVRGIFLPFIEFLDEMVKERMPVSEIRAILGEVLGEAFEFDESDFLNSNDKFEVLAGAKLAAKKAMAQALPLMIQVIENPALVQQLNAMGYAVDAKLLFDMFMEVSEWKDERELIRPMTQKEQQLFAQNNPGLQKVQGNLAEIAAKHQAKAAEIDQNHEASLAAKMMLQAGEGAAGYVARQEEREQMRQGPFAEAAA